MSASGAPWADGFVLWTWLARRPLEPDHGMPASIRNKQLDKVSDQSGKLSRLAGFTV